MMSGHNLNLPAALAGLLTLCLQQPAQAQTVFDGKDKADALINMSFMQGGEKISSHVSSGDGISLGVGAVFAIADSGVTLQTSINYFNDELGTDNGKSMERFPLELLGFYHTGAHRIGGGITYHIDPAYGGTNGKREIAFDNATGYVIEYDYVFNNRFAIGLRHTEIEYDSDDIEDSVDGSHNGLTFTLFI